MGIDDYIDTDERKLMPMSDETQSPVDPNAKAFGIQEHLLTPMQVVKDRKESYD